MHELILLLIETPVSTLLGETVTDSAPAEIITDAVSDKMRNTPPGIALSDKYFFGFSKQRYGWRLIKGIRSLLISGRKMDLK